MILVSAVQNIIRAGTQQLLLWAEGLLPQVFLFLILLNAVTRLIGRARVERLAARCGSHAFLRYALLPFLSALVLGNPVAISMGRYLPERYKPAYFASASYHCHTNSGLFHHINPAELFIWLGIANGILALGLDPFPLALRYLSAGLAANFLSGYATEHITKVLEKREHLRLRRGVHLEEADSVFLSGSGGPEAEIAPRKTAPAPSHTAQADPAAAAEGTGAEALKAAAPEAADTAAQETEATAGVLRSITITSGDGGYGGPVTIVPTEKQHIVLYMTAGGAEPEPLARIVALSGMTAVNGNAQTVPDEEVALAIIDCGGTLRCGIYPGKGIPTVNLLATGRSGPLAKYMTADLYVSAVTSAQVRPAEPDQTLSAQAGRERPAEPERDKGGRAHPPAAPQAAFSAAGAGQASRWMNRLLRPASAVSRVVSVFHQSARDAVRTCVEILLPFMGFAALFVGFCKGSGLTAFLADLLQPLGGSLPGLIGLGIICSLPGLSAVLGAGAVAAQMFATVIGDLIASGSISPAMALPALFAINCQCACDFIPVGLGMTEARPDTTRIGISAITLSRFATGWIRILIGLVFSIGLYR